jgi:hypothetical protein
MQDAIIARKVRNWSKTALANGRFWPSAVAANVRFWPKADFGRSASRPRLRALVCHAPLELHYCERSAQGLVGYLNRTMKWLVHVQYKVNGSRNE